MCDNDIQTDQNAVKCEDERVALANLIANLKLDVDENKKIQKQLKKAKTSLDHELKECKSILAETSRTLGESNSIRNSFLIALQNKQTELETYKTLNDRTVDYDKLKHKLNETLGLLAQKEIDIKEGLKLKSYKISVVIEKHDELVKQSLLTKSHYEGFVKEKIKVITDLKLKEEKDIDNSLERKFFSKTKSVPKTNVSEGLSKPVTTQISPQIARQAVRNTNVIKPDMYRIDTRTTQTRAPQLPQTYKNTNPRVSTSTGVIHITNVSRPQLRNTQMKDKSVTACNDNLKSITLNVNVVCATCGKCVFNLHHGACVSKFLNDVNARNKKPKVVPISTRKPKRQTNKSVATPPKKIVASESTIQKSKSYYRMLYEKTSKGRKWWIEQQCPLGYKWVPKTKLSGCLKLGMTMGKRELVLL
ncbi:hypothetical protein Tco_1577084 [Tanacetum coccineum]